MKTNNEKWVLFQIHDEVLDRWSPVYCGATTVSVDLEIKDMMKKTSDRPITLRILGAMENGLFYAESSDRKYGSLEVLNED